MPKQRAERGTGKLPWAKIRKRFEVDGDAIEALAREYGISKPTIYRRIKAEGWAPKRSRSGEVTEAAVKMFVARQAEAVARNAERKHAITTRMLGIIEKQVDRMEKAKQVDSLDFRRYGSTLVDITGVDSLLAGLKEHDDWRPTAGRVEDASEPHTDAVRAVLEEAARDGSDGGSDGSQGPLSDGS